MKKQSFELIGIFYILYFNVFCAAQRFKVCDAGQECTPIRSCTEMVRLVQTGLPENIRRVRNAICGFEQRKSLVCCTAPDNVTSRPPVATPPVLTGNTNDALLPKKGSCGRPSTEDKIINGTPAPIGGYPWLAAFGYTERGTRGFAFSCAGSIINSKYVLTAAHCVNRADIGRKRLAVIHLGDWDLSSSPDCQVTRRGAKCSAPHIVAGYEEIVIHPLYNTRGRSSDDIALIRLNITLDFDNEGASVEPVCLPSSNVDIRSLVGDRQPIAAGWGLTEHGNNSNIMLRVNVPLVDDQKCTDRYNRDFVGNQLCVGGEGGFDTCMGDSGGPLILPEPAGPPFTQIGIVSFGPFPCGLQNFPGVYTSVKDYKSWILENIRP